MFSITQDPETLPYNGDWRYFKWKDRIILQRHSWDWYEFGDYATEDEAIQVIKDQAAYEAAKNAIYYRVPRPDDHE